MFDYSWTQRGKITGILRDLGLTPGHMKTLFVLQPGEQKPMGEIAGACGCDASTATWLVDRLEDRELVERRALAGDRRVKAVALTKRGAKLRTTLLERLYEPPDALLNADRVTLKTLRDALRTLPDPAHDFADHEVAGDRPA